MHTVADIQSTDRWDRHDPGRLAAPRRRVAAPDQTLPIEIQQIELQILGAHRRRDQALQELNNQQRQIEHATEVQDFLRDKFTSHELYLWLQQETAGPAPPDVRAGRCTPRTQAQRAFNFERGHTDQRFIAEEPGTTCTRGCWPASGWSSRCAAWRRRTWTRTGASTS